MTTNIQGQEEEGREKERDRKAEQESGILWANQGVNLSAFKTFLASQDP